MIRQTIHTRWFARWLLSIMLVASLLVPARGVHAAPLAQNDAAAECAEGVRLFLADNFTGALPHLQAGFAGRQSATFAAPDDLGLCALALTLLRFNAEDWDGMLEAGEVARDVLQHSQSHQAEYGVTLQFLPVAYAKKGQQQEALDLFIQALQIWSKLGDPERIRSIRLGIADTYEALGLVSVYDRRIDYYQQARDIYHELGEPVREAQVWSEIGEAHYSEKKYAAAVEAFQQAHALIGKVDESAENRAGLATLLGNLGEAFSKGEHYVEAIDAYTRARALFASLDNSAREAQILRALGGAYAGNHEDDKAIQSYQEAQALMQGAGDDVGAGRALTDLGNFYNDRRRYPEAVAALRQAAQAFQRAASRPTAPNEVLNSNDPRKLANATLIQIAQIYQAQAQFPQALEAYQELLEYARSIANAVVQEATPFNVIGEARRTEGDALYHMGDIYIDIGAYGKALESLQEAIAVYEGINRLNPTNPGGSQITFTVETRTQQALAQLKIGEAYRSQGRYDLAQQAYEQARERFIATEDAVGESLALNNLGELYRSQARYDEAITALQQSIALAREHAYPRGENQALYNLGLVYLEQERNDLALTTLQDVLKRWQDIGDPLSIGLTVGALGSVYANLGRYDEALQSYQQALDIRTQLGDQEGIGVVLNNIGFLYQRQGQFDQALANYEHAMDALETVRAAAGSDPGRASFIARYVDLYDRVIALYHQQNQDASAFVVSERGRARAFLDALATGQVQLSDAEAELLAAEQRLYAVRRALQTELYFVRGANEPDPISIAERTEQLKQAEQDYAAARATIEARNDQLAGLIGGRTIAVDVSQVQAQLDPQTTMVAYYVLDEQTLAFVLTRTDFHTEALPIGREALRTLIMALRTFPNTDDPLPANALTLYNDLIAPLKSHITTPHLLIVPHSVLHYLPFAALSDGQTYLADSYTLTTLPSASTLPYIQANTGRPAAAPLIVGNPSTGASGLKPLAYAEREAQDIAALYGVEPLLGSDATQAAVETRAPEAGIIHIAAHGIYDQENPLASAIALAPDGSGDGRLKVSAVYGLDIHKSDLVVLSACETQLGPLSAGDEVVSLTRSLIFAGTPSVIATLWSIEDSDATQLLMKSFYTYLRQGMGKAEALRKAQADLRAYRDPNGKQIYASPYYWSGFVLSGDGGRVATAAPLWPWMIAGAVALVLLGAAIVLWRRRRARQLKDTAEELRAAPVSAPSYGENSHGTATVRSMLAPAIVSAGSVGHTGGGTGGAYFARPSCAQSAG